ncbi:MAG: prepilin-type N-terminal cleavage/methylation domain-containing protein [Eubacteriales bacterium]
MLEKFRKNKKGFTLVEVIVVLVILAILAAIMIPSLAGYIDKANEKRYIAEARSVYLAAQTVLSEDYGLNGDMTAATITVTNTTTGTGLDADISKLAEVATTYSATITYGADGAISNFSYTAGNYTVTRSNSTGTFECNKTDAVTTKA